MSTTGTNDFSSIGKPMPRNEDARLLTGKGRFTDDFAITDMVHAVMVRSPHPHARIRGIDKSAALAMPGVLGVFTGADVAADALKPVPHDPIPKTKYDMKLAGPGGTPIFIGPHMLLPADKARHVGEAVAMVVAETEAQAQDAAEAVEVDYEVLPFVVDQRKAIKPGHTPVWDETPDNCFVDTTFGDVAGTDRAFSRADHVVKMDIYIPRVTGVTIEPRSALGDYDAATGRYLLHCGGGGAVRQKHELALVLGVEPDQVRVLTFDVGGNFGTKNRVYVEYGLVMWAAKKVGRAVKNTISRSEAFLTDYQGRDLAVKAELALDASGKILAMRSDNMSNAGSRCVSLSPLGKGSGLITGSYDIPVATLRARAVFTNTVPTQAYRSSGRPEVNFVIERLMDTAAAELGFDKIELRRKNLVRPDQFPYTNAVGASYDSGEYEKNMDWAMDIADWKGAEARRTEAKSRGKLYGVGLANYVESSIGTPKERTEITIHPEGKVFLRDRHAAVRPGSRDELRPGRRGSLPRAGRERHDHHRRHRHREGRRRLALGPLDAARRHRHLEGQHAAHRQGQGHCGVRARQEDGRDRLRRRTVHARGDEPVVLDVRTRPRSREGRPAGRIRRPTFDRPHQRDARAGVSERHGDLRSRD